VVVAPKTLRLPGRSSDLYTADVRRFLVCVLSLLIVVLSAIDPIYCMDGCGRAGLTASNTAAAGATDCPFCSGLFAPVVAPFTAEIVVLESIPRVRVALPALLLTCAIERPPRA
jgi:hypothetical protein